MRKEEMIQKIKEMSDDELYKFITYLLVKEPTFSKELKKNL